MPTNLRNDILVEATRLHHFIQNNQLVQANALAQKTEVMMHKIMLLENPAKVEDHPYWIAYRNLLQVKSMILSGRTTDARLSCEAMLAKIGGLQ